MIDGEELSRLMSDLREVFWVEPRAAVNERAEIVLRQQDEHPVAGLERSRKRVLMHDSRIYRLLSGMDPLRDYRQGSRWLSIPPRKFFT